jgi:hypothetical protein
MMTFAAMVFSVALDCMPSLERALDGHRDQFRPRLDVGSFPSIGGGFRMDEAVQGG